jgi:5-methylcytosine-specific restriction endonuclease McrA
MYHPDLLRHPESCPSLVLNADYTPLSYYPLSLWPWQAAIKAVFLDRVDIVSSYEREVHSPNLDMKIPSVIALKKYIKPSEYPAFTRFNLFLRDKFECQYCGSPDNLTFDHVIPRRQKGRTTWENVATACLPCNLKKARTDAERSTYAACQSTDKTDQLASAGTWPGVPSQFSSRYVARLALLGYRAGKLSR